MAKQSRVAAKPKPAFDWTKLASELTAARPGQRARADIPGGFTVVEYATNHGLTYSCAYSRVRRLVTSGIVRKVAVVQKTILSPSGGRSVAQEGIYDLVNKS